MWPRWFTLQLMAATFEILHVGYVRDEGSSVGSTVSLVRDGAAIIVVDPGMVADRELILDPLRVRGIGPEDVTHVVLTHHHPDHALHMGLFPNAEVVDFWARYHGDQWLDHGGDGTAVSQHSRILLTPGHTAEDLTLLVETDDGVVACTHCWWHADRTPEVDPLCDDQGALAASRERILAEADHVVPGHGPAFPTGRSSPDLR